MLLFRRLRTQQRMKERRVADVVGAFDVLLNVVEASERLSEALKRGDHASGRSAVVAIADAFSTAVGSAPLPRRSEAATVGDRFIVDVPMLCAACRFLAARGKAGHGEAWKEAFHYVAGMAVADRTYVLGRIVPVDYAAQSAGGVRVADSSNIKALESLDRAGLPLVAHVHSHPGRGAEATRPSPTDRSFQERLERGGHIAVGLIFDRCGTGVQYLRFFAGEGREFEVDVHGHGVEEVDRHVYRLALGNGGVPLAHD